MAALQTLRNKAGVIISVVIGVALLAFILGDLLGSGNSIFSSNDEIGEIDGQTIKVQDYQQRVDEFEAFTKMNQQTMSLTEDVQNQLRENVWQSMIQDITFNKQYEKAGIEVTADEILDMVVGNHIAQSLRPLFSNPQTGIYDRQFAENFLRNKNSDPQASFYWSFIEKSVKTERESAKYMALIRKGIYLNKAQMAFEKAARSQAADINYVGIRYAAIPDSTVSVSNNEIKARYEQNKKSGLYEVDAARDIEYVTFPVTPTDDDRMATEEYVHDLMSDFSAPETDAESFAQRNAETAQAARFRNEAELGRVGEWAKGAKVGEVYGPYREGDAYMISRLVAVENRPDTVKARHILIVGNDQLADSLFDRAKAGDDFAQLARQYSQDNGSAVNGGDLGWFADGTMVPEFNEACFNNPKGAVVKVQSQYGTHIINVQDKGVPNKKYKVATIDKSIQFSQKTHQAVFTEANQFAINNRTAESFDAQSDSLKLIKRRGINIRQNAQSINSIRHAREIVKWAYKAEVGEVSELFECDDEFIVAVLVRKQDKGNSQLADVQPAIERELLKEKKTAQLTTAEAGKSLEEIAADYNAKVDSASNVRFALNSVTGAGIEPSLVGSVMAAEQGNLTGAVKGNNAAYFFVKNSETNEEVSDDAIKLSYSQQLQRLEYVVARYITDVEIEDNRIKFY